MREQIEFAKSGLMTSRIGLGTWAMGGRIWGGTDEAQSIATIRSAIDRGVTLIDTVLRVSANLPRTSVTLNLTR
jgi:aryl-alcohol dehydrogenase-like predicted oxidoreductase